MSMNGHRAKRVADPDFGKAMSWYRKPAGHGIATALASLGWRHFHGLSAK